VGIFLFLILGLFLYKQPVELSDKEKNQKNAQHHVINPSGFDWATIFSIQVIVSKTEYANF